MAVLFNSIIEPNQLGGWQIRLVDTLENEEVICKDVDEYAQKIEEMGMGYGGEIEVKWAKDELITTEQFNEIEVGMKKFQDELEKKDD